MTKIVPTALIGSVLATTASLSLALAASPLTILAV